MVILNSLVNDPWFKKTSLNSSFSKKPLGFIDTGALGGVHSLIAPVASLTHCTCFEPFEQAYKELCEKYSSCSPFSKLNILNIAISNKNSEEVFFTTVSAVNSSLLKPNREIAYRYNVQGLFVKEETLVKTDTLDNLLSRGIGVQDRLGEFIKTDCQGADFKVLEGASKTIDSQCMALHIEVQFLEQYEGQKLFPEIDIYLRKRGFLLYGFYPKYISTKRLDRRLSDTEERLVNADALYFKDPLDLLNVNRSFSKRDIEVLLLIATITHYYDFALELVDKYYADETDRKYITNLILSMSAIKSKTIVDSLSQLLEDIKANPIKSYLLAKKFIDTYKSNNDVSFLKLER